MYDRDNPKWVRATVVIAAGKMSVDVTTPYGDWRNCSIRPHPTDKLKSTVFVQDDNDDWLRIWFLDRDIQ